VFQLCSVKELYCKIQRSVKYTRIIQDFDLDYIEKKQQLLIAFVIIKLF